VPTYARIDVTAVTSRTAPPYGTITHAERLGPHVLRGEGDLLLVGPLGVNYYVENATNEFIRLRRFDMPPEPRHESATLEERAWGQSPR
jgi:hypothetical protein